VNEREPFLKALEENEDDTPTRLVYADWLDDNGEHEEADRQRKWPAAKEWLVRFFREHDEGDYYGQLKFYEDLIRLGRKAVEEADERGIVLDCGSNQGMCDALRANSGEFWKNWSIVTGIAMPQNVEEKAYFSCAC
jgi:uncharacterized protein (TIGR02996 family)